MKPESPEPRLQLTFREWVLCICWVLFVSPWLWASYRMLLAVFD